MYMNAFQIVSNSSHFYNLLVDNVCGAPRTTAAAKSYVKLDWLLSQISIASLGKTYKTSYLVNWSKSFKSNRIKTIGKLALTKEKEDNYMKNPYPPTYTYLLRAAAFRVGGIWNAICLLHLDRWPNDHNLAILDTDINVGRDVNPRRSRSIHYDDNAEFRPRVRVRELDSRARSPGDAHVLVMENLCVAAALHLYGAMAIGIIVYVHGLAIPHAEIKDGKES